MKYNLSSMLADIARDEQGQARVKQHETASQDDIRALRLARRARKLNPPDQDRDKDMPDLLSPDSL